MAEEQQWEDEAYCNEYASTCDISINDIHYGWLAPGESKLELLSDINWEVSTVLDIGCGMGENLVAMSDKGPTCFGIDISPYMLRYAKRTVLKAINPENIFLFEEDMLNLEKCFPDISFDLVISAYAMEYLENTECLRKVLNAVYHRLQPGGVFVFCFSHPLQHYKHCDIRNKSDRPSKSKCDPLFYSFLDVIKCLDDVGFTIDRIVEQGTKNPSTISHEASQSFPYRFYKEKNPCQKSFDEISNQAPHTVIYKVRKPTEDFFEQQGKLDMSNGTRTLWRETRKISAVDNFFAGDTHFYVEKYDKPFDDIVGACVIIDKPIEASDLSDLSQLELMAFRRNQIVDTKIQSNSIFGIVHTHLLKHGLRPLYYESDFVATDSSKSKLTSEMHIQRIEPIHSAVSAHFPGCYTGLLLFINGEEPGSGKVNLTSLVPKLGDSIQLIYVAGELKKRRISSNQKRFINQIPLF